jgi:hypothetical protein
MKKIFFVAMALYVLLAACDRPAKIQDGLYLVAGIVNKGGPHPANKAYAPFDPSFINDAPEGTSGVLLDLDNWVPLELSAEPTIIGGQDEKKKLDLSFSAIAAERLRTFTAAHLMESATMVVDGKALTVQKIRDTITGGKLQITRCDDNACERIFLRLKERAAN